MLPLKFFGLIRLVEDWSGISPEYSPMAGLHRALPCSSSYSDGQSTEISPGCDVKTVSNQNHDCAAEGFRTADKVTWPNNVLGTAHLTHSLLLPGCPHQSQSPSRGDSPTLASQTLVQDPG